MKIILVGFLTSIVCQMGDLFFSFLKRKANVKDTGNFFPGHGGVLDRLEHTLEFLAVLFSHFIVLMKNISILGSTYSGLSTLKIIDKKKIFLE